MHTTVAAPVDVSALEPLFPMQYTALLCLQPRVAMQERQPFRSKHEPASRVVLPAEYLM